MTQKTDQPQNDDKIIDELEQKFKEGLAGIKDLIAAMGMLKLPAQPKHLGSHWGSHNHNQKRNKKRAKMARKSNQINRLRVKGWKH